LRALIKDYIFKKSYPERGAGKAAAAKALPMIFSAIP
jgi:hypothetical protein